MFVLKVGTWLWININLGWLKSKKIKKVQHDVFPCGHPPQYWRRPSKLGLQDRTGLRIFFEVWSYLNFHEILLYLSLKFREIGWRVPFTFVWTRFKIFPLLFYFFSLFFLFIILFYFIFLKSSKIFFHYFVILFFSFFSFSFSFSFSFLSFPFLLWTLV